MLKRLVRPVEKYSFENTTKRPFSDFNNESSIVLLGDPGAGKTHLFKYYAEICGGRYLTARDFLIVLPDSINNIEYLFVDALDEKRIGRGIDSTIDQIASRLAEVAPKRIRLACRAADWLGDYDLSALRAVLPPNDEIKILALEHLSFEEQQDLLVDLNETDPEMFINHATVRGLESMLKNPQTLKMLWEQVGSRGWPKTRKELYANSFELLVSEHNSVHKLRSSKAISNEERLKAAGAACALRLISDIRGIGLHEVSDDVTCPSYNDVTLTPQDHLLTAISSRLFTFDDAINAVDYLHRTLAEYAAAWWLAEQVRRGLPLGRVIALITYEGIPTTELRGLHAWLAVLLQEYAVELIEADPFGVMAYGDPASLSSGIRLQLINALAKLAERDPWFRAGNWNVPVSGLGNMDLIPQFREILSDINKSHNLRSIILDAILESRLAREIFDTLIELIKDANVITSERKAAIDAILQVEESGHQAILNLYTHLSNSKNNFKVRVHIISSIYGKGIGPIELAALLREALLLDEDLLIGELWHLSKVIPDSDIQPILDEFNPQSKSQLNEHDQAPPPNNNVSHENDGLEILDDFESQSSSAVNDHNRSNVLYVLDNLICRALNTPVDAKSLLNWLKKRADVGEHYYSYDNDRLRKSLAQNQTLLATITKHYFTNCANKNQGLFALHDYGILTLSATDSSIILDCMCTALHSEDPATRPFYMEIALALALRIGPEASAEFESLLALRDEPGLGNVVDKFTYQLIENWRIKEAERKKEKEVNRNTALQRTRIRFNQDLDGILKGTHLGWMGYIGESYFHKFLEVDEHTSPEQRIKAALGCKSAKHAISGVIKFTSEGPYPLIEDILETNLQSSYKQYWYAHLAGLCELHKQGYSLDLIDEDRLRSALIIDQLLPTFTTQNNVISKIEHSWKSELLERRPAFVAEVYNQLARHQLTAGQVQINVLKDLFGCEQLKEGRSELVTELLLDFPTCSRTDLEYLISVALTDAPNKLKELIPVGRNVSSESNNIDAWSIWTTFGLLLDVNGCLADIEISDSDTNKILIRDICNAFGSGRGQTGKATRSVDENIEEFIIQFVGSKFDWSPDINLSDETEFVVARINRLATFTSLASVEAIERLIADDSLFSYRQYLKHALATQRILRADSKYIRPSWLKIQEALKGGIPANAADLQALAIAHIEDIGNRIAGANTDPYKQFWNVDSNGRIDTPKPEEDCRDALVEMLRPRLAPLSIRVEPEGHMASDKRADICLYSDEFNLIIELKRDYNPELWSAIELQLDRLYTRDPESHGFGIYGVFWFGDKRPRNIPLSPSGHSCRDSAKDLEETLKNEMPKHLHDKIQIFVLDVSDPLAK